ncbi:peptidylprolyl isomerase [Solibacillus sp. FSL W7-1464]|uniref:peptidylprolyl isomerase n=1 Tax=Solibacillus sp. FSL W7-1464 TaxID=2921706 RepID=UPI0030FBBB11
MKKLLSLMFVTAILLAACNSSEMSITQVQKIPPKVQESIDFLDKDDKLQVVNDSKSDVKYIIIQSAGTVTAELEERENILDIKLDTENETNSELKQHVFKVTRGDAQYDSINVKINGQDTPIDNSTGF